MVLQLFIWGIDTWEKHRSKPLQIPAGRVPSPQAITRVQFHQDQIHFLAVHETQLAIYETAKLERLKQVKYQSFYIYVNGFICLNFSVAVFQLAN
jgi:hypothetical protein